MKLNQLILIILCTSLLCTCKKSNTIKQVDKPVFNKGIYTNKDLGWILKIPKDWEVVNKEDSEEVEQNNNTNGFKKLITFKKDPLNIFEATLEPFDEKYDGEWEDNNVAVKRIVYEAYQNKGLRVDSSETKTEQIDGLEFKYYTLKLFTADSLPVLNQILYSSFINGNDFGVHINYNIETEKDIMLNAWRSSKFNKK